MTGPLRLAVLGARRLLGQYLLDRVRAHPWFRVTALADLEGPHGTAYADGVEWLLARPIPEAVADLPVVQPDEPLEADLAISMLPDGRAAALERHHAAAGLPLVSHAEDLRLARDVPLVVPELTPDALEDPTSRLLATPNCTTVIAALPLAALHRAFGVEAVIATSLQAVSGADLPGHPAYAIADTVLPNLAGEEAALEQETARLFAAAFPVSAHAVRVPVRLGHCLTLSVKLCRSPRSAASLARVLEAFRAPAALAGLPSALEAPISVMAAPMRPRPLPDAWQAEGTAITVGGLRACPVLDWRLTLVGNNMIRGSVLTALLAAERLAATWFGETVPAGEARHATAGTPAERSLRGRSEV